MGYLAEGLKKNSLQIDEIATYLDGLDASARVTEVRSLGPSAQKALWSMTEGSEPRVGRFRPRDGRRAGAGDSLRSEYLASL